MGRGGMRFFAGRPGWHVKAEHCLRLDVRSLARRGVLQGGRFGWSWTNTGTGECSGSIGIAATTDNLTLNYAVNGTPVSESVWLERTRCNYGGTRPWLRCPGCQRRSGVLFMRSGRFRCRKCAQVRYSSQSEDLCGRMWRRQAKLEAKLGENWSRPKGMHRRTQTRLLDQIWTCEEVRDAAIVQFVMSHTGLFG